MGWILLSRGNPAIATTVLSLSNDDGQDNQFDWACPLPEMQAYTAYSLKLKTLAILFFFCEVGWGDLFMRCFSMNTCMYSTEMASLTFNSCFQPCPLTKASTKTASAPEAARLEPPIIALLLPNRANSPNPNSKKNKLRTFEPFFCDYQ